MKAGVAFLLVLAGASPPLAEQISGRAVYQNGAGTVPVIGGRPRPSMSARLTCGGCHGADGLGGREGGASKAPPITWAALTQATATRPAYTDETLARALTTCEDPSGRILQMPCFMFDKGALVALRGHLQALDQQEHQGINAQTIILNLPSDPHQATAAQAAIAAFNAEGGSYGRQVQTGDAAFFDLGAALARLHDSLPAAEDSFARAQIAGYPDAEVLARNDDAAPLHIRRGSENATIGPPLDSMIWASDNAADLEAARYHALTRLILDELRQAGRGVTRTSFARRIEALDLTAALALHPDD